MANPVVKELARFYAGLGMQANRARAAFRAIQLLFSPAGNAQAGIQANQEDASDTWGNGKWGLKEWK